MQAISKMHQSPRCRAKSKRSQEGCKAPAVRGWEVCRMHGARGGAPEGQANGKFTSGYFSKQAKENRLVARKAVSTVRALRRLLAEIDA
jgi:hypothetical protein